MIYSNFHAQAEMLNYKGEIYVKQIKIICIPRLNTHKQLYPHTSKLKKKKELYITWIIPWLEYSILLKITQNYKAYFYLYKCSLTSIPLYRDHLSLMCFEVQLSARNLHLSFHVNQDLGMAGRGFSLGIIMLMISCK